MILSPATITPVSYTHLDVYKRQLYAYVLARLQYWSMLAQKDEDKLLKRLLNASDRERNSAKKKQAAELKKAEKRKAEVDGLFAKMYEDWSAGRITEYNFNMLSEKYQNEQKELEDVYKRQNLPYCAYMGLQN